MKSGVKIKPYENKMELFVIMTIIFFCLFIFHMKSINDNALKKSSSVLSQHLSAYGPSFQNIKLIKHNDVLADIYDRVSAKTNKDCINILKIYLGCSKINQYYSLKFVISEYKNRSDLYYALEKQKHHITSLKIYAIKKWINYADSNTLEQFLIKINNIISKFKFNPELARSFIDNEIKVLK